MHLLAVGPTVTMYGMNFSFVSFVSLRPYPQCCYLCIQRQLRNSATYSRVDPGRVLSYPVAPSSQSLCLVSE